MRFIVKNGGLSHTQCLALDDALYQLRQKNEVPDTIFLWRPAKFVYIINNASIKYINTEVAEAAGYPLTRSAMLPGKPTSAVIVGDMWNLITAVSDLKEEVGTHFMKFGPMAWKSIVGKLGLDVDIRIDGADIVLKGTDKKIGGFGLGKMDNNGAYINCYLSEKLPQVDLDKIFMLPEEKFEGKTVASVSERITSLEAETGQLFDQEWLVESIADYFKSIGVSLEREDDFTRRNMTWPKR